MEWLRQSVFVVVVVLQKVESRNYFPIVFSFSKSYKKTLHSASCTYKEILSNKIEEVSTEQWAFWLK